MVEALNAAVNEALKRQDLRDKLVKLGAEPAGGTPEELAVFMKKNAEIWTDVVRKADIKLD